MLKFGTKTMHCHLLRNASKKDKKHWRRAPLRKIKFVGKSRVDADDTDGGSALYGFEVGSVNVKDDKDCGIENKLNDNIVKAEEDNDDGIKDKLNDIEKINVELKSFNGLGSDKKSELNRILVPVLQAIRDDHTKLASKDIERTVSDILTNIGLETHYIGVTGGSKNVTDAKQSVKHLAVALAWTFAQKFGTEISDPLTQTLPWLVVLMCVDFRLIVDFCHYMRTKKEYSSSTVYNYLCSLSSAVKYFCHYCSKSLGENVPTVESADVAAVTDLISRLQAAYKKNGKKGNVKSIQSEIYDRHQPSGGSAELRRMARERGEAFLLQNGATGQHDVTKDVYKECLSLIFVHWYVFAPQGRLSGIADMRFGQFQDLVDIGHAVSENFKTRAFYFYQPVINVPEAFPYLHKYMVFRQHVVRSSSVNASDFLFLDWKGNPIGDKVGTYFTSFWSQYNLHITTTDVRSLIETETAEKVQSGTLSAAHQNAVAKVSGHSSQVVKEFYLMKDVAKNVGLAREASNIVMSEPSVSGTEPSSVPSKPTNCSLMSFAHTQAEKQDSDDSDDDALCQRLPLPLSLWPEFTKGLEYPIRFNNALPPVFRATHDARVVANWGIEHPDYKATNSKTGKPAKRAVWTKAECDWIRDWCSRKREVNPDVNNIVSKCLHAIRKDPEAIKIFHEIHTLDVGRLRTGYMKACGIDSLMSQSQIE